MKVIYTSILNPWDRRHGGGQIIVHELASAMAARGHDVDVVYSATGVTPSNDLSYRAHFVPHHERLYLNPLEFARFLRRARTGGAIVHANGYEGAFHRVGTLGRAALVVTSHHPDPVDLVDAPGRIQLLRRALWSRQRIIPLIERRALRSADLVTATSAFSACALRKRGYLPPTRRIEVVPSGVPPLPATRPPEVEVELVCIARLDYHKGIDVLLQALSILEEPKPALDLVGAGSEEQTLRRLARKLGVEHKVRFRGHQDRAMVVAILRGATALVLSSRSENFPLAILEAMQAGVPIVATRVGGIPESVRDEIEALLVPPEDPVALAAALTRVLRDGKLRRRLSDAARSRVRDFSWDQVAERYESLYAALAQ